MGSITLRKLLSVLIILLDKDFLVLEMHRRDTITKIRTIMECLRDTIHYPDKLSNKQT